MSRNKNGIRDITYDLSRINEWWLISVGLVLFAYVPYNYNLNGNSIDYEFLRLLLATPSVYLAVLTVFSAQIFLFASNDYFDRNVDALDPKKRVRNPVSDGRVTMSGVRMLLIVTGIIPLCSSLYFGIHAFAFTAVTLVVFFYYTAPPPRLKNKVFFDVLSHGLLINTFPYFFCLVALKDFNTGTTFLLFAIMIRSTIAQMLQEIRDYHIDKQVEKNSVVVLGQKRALWVVFTLFLILMAITSTLLISHELLDWGIPLYYIIILILCISYLPIFYKLLRTDDYSEEIERLWMGQGRTNRRLVAQYFGSFSVYFVFVMYLFATGY